LTRSREKHVSVLNRQESRGDAHQRDVIESQASSAESKRRRDIKFPKWIKAGIESSVNQGWSIGLPTNPVTDNNFTAAIRLSGRPEIRGCGLRLS
jgi:hypothetical protein